MQVDQIGWLQAPFDFGVTAQGASAGARRVNQNAIELAAERQGLGGIEDHRGTIEIAHLLHAVEVDIAGDGANSLLDGLGGLIAGRRAQIEEGLAGMQIEQRHDGLRADVLGAASARDVIFDRLKECSSDLIGSLAAEPSIPFVEQPCGHGQSRRAIRPRHRRAVGFSQDCIHQPRCGRSAQPLHQLDTFADGGVWRDAIEITQLINAHAKSNEYFRLGRARDAACNQVIELGLEAETAEDNLGGETGIPRVKLRGTLEEQVRSIAAVVNFSEDFEGDLARGGDQLLS